MTTAEALGGMNLFDAARTAGITFSAEVLPQDQYVQANDMRLHYLDWGNSGKPKMLLLHGGAQTAHSWDFFALAMRDHFHIVALDQRGHGDSAWSEAGDYDTTSHVADVQAFTKAIGYDNFVLIGLSMGGRNAYGFAAKYPQKVHRLVVIDVGPDVQQEGRRHIQEFLEGTETFESFDWLVQRVQRYNPRRPEAQIRGSLLNNIKQMADGRWTWKHDRRRGVRRDRGGEMNQAAWEDLAKVQAPTLIVRGAESNMLSVQTATKMLNTIKGSRLVEVPQAGHLVQGDNPVAFEKTVREFLSLALP